jgi:hypothetical protein
MFSVKCSECGVVGEYKDIQAFRRHIVKCCKKAGVRPLESLTRHINKPTQLPNFPVVLRCTRSVCSQNDFKAKSHWFYVKDAKGWLNHLEPLVMGADLNGLVLGFSEWSITRVFKAPRREFDWANLVGGAKPIPDALKRLGVIFDDSPAHFKCSYDQVLGDGPSTVITLLNGTP